MADAGVGRHDAEVVERRLAPAQERVALAVALELELGVALESEPLGEHVDLDRVVDHQLDRHERVDPGRVAAQLVHRVAHGGQVDDRRHAGEVLHQHARGRVGDLGRGLVRRLPSSPTASGALVLAVAQQVLEQDLERVRAGAGRVDREDLVATRRRPRAWSCVTFLDTTCRARPGLRRPPALDLLRRDGHGRRRSPGPGGAPASTWCCSPTTTRSRPSATARRAGTATCCCSSARRCRRGGATTTSPSGSTRRSTTRGSTPPASAARCATPAASASPRTRSREGSERFKRARPGMPFDELDCDALDGIELWSFVTDTGEAVASVREMLALPAPRRAASLDHPPERNMRAWDELCRTRRVVAIGGLDAHQFGKRIGPVRAAAADGLPPLVPATSAPTCCARSRSRRARARPRAGLRGAARGALLHRGRLDRARARLPLRGGRPADGRRGAGGRAARCARARRADARLRLLRDGVEIASGAGRALDARGRGAGRLPGRGAAPRARGASAPGSCRTRSTCAAGREREGSRQPDDVVVGVVRRSKRALTA